MNRIKKFSVVITLIITLFSMNSYALVGAGFHWGFDLSLSMEDNNHDPVGNAFLNPDFIFGQMDEDLKKELNDILKGTNFDVDTIFTLVKQQLGDITIESPMYLSRSNLRRSNVNLGGKVFIDKMVFFDQIEVSFNIGAWDYESKLHYPAGVKSSISVNDVQQFIETGDYGLLFDMQAIDLSLKNAGMSYLDLFGLSNTPYVKMNFDVTVLRNFIEMPPATKLFKLYGGAGASLHIGTPMMTSSFVEDILAQEISNIKETGKLTDLASATTGKDIAKRVLDDFVKQSKKPLFGAHIAVGTSVKLPIIPIQFYIDGKFAIPFGRLNKETNLSGYGVFVNTGIALKI